MAISPGVRTSLAVVGSECFSHSQCMVQNKQVHITIFDLTINNCVTFKFIKFTV